MTLTEPRPTGPWNDDPWDRDDTAVAVEPLRRQTRAIKWTVWIAMAVVLAMVLALGAYGWWYIRQINPPGDPGPPVNITIGETETLDELAVRLESEGVIVNSDVFLTYVERNGGLELTPGYYQLRPGDHMGNIMGRLGTPPAQTYTSVTFPEGFTLEEMARRLEETVPRMSAEDFLAAASDPDVVSSLRPPVIPSLEGVLFPDTYQVSNAESEGQVIERMIGLMERVAAQEDLEEGARRLGYSPYQVLVVASMIEKEAKLDEDRPKIARVIYNRLEAPETFPLQIDATLYYQQDRSTPFSELRQLDTPYNTYQYPGLPPTPIANPGRASIRAALNPAPNPPPGDPLCQELPDPTVGCELYYYVLADEDGRHAFAVTLDQHERNIEAAREAGVL